MPTTSNGKESLVGIEPGESSTLNEDERTAMSKLLKEIAPMNSIYDLGFRNLAEMHKLDI